MRRRGHRPDDDDADLPPPGGPGGGEPSPDPELTESSALVFLSDSDVRRLDSDEIPPDDLDAGLGGEPAANDLSESQAVVFLSDSDVRRLDSGDELPRPSGQEPVPAAEPGDADDLSESTTFVFLSGSDVRRLDGAGDADAAAAAASGGARKRKKAGPRRKGGQQAAAAGGGRGGRGGGARPPAQPPAPRRRWPWAIALLAAWALSLWVFHEVDRRLWHGEGGADQVARLEAERDRALAGWQRAREESEASVAALEETLDRERARLEADARDSERRAAELEQQLAAARRAFERERDALAQGQVEEVGAREAALERRLAERARRERLDLERQVADTVARYEALLAEAETAREKFVEVVRREARAEVLRRESVLRQRFEEERAALEARRQEELEREAERIEARLREELSAPAGFGEAEAGFLREADALFGEGEPEGIDLESEVWEHLKGHLSGQATYRLYGYLERSEQPEAERQLHQGIITLRYEVDLTGWLRLHVAPRLQMDDGDLSEGVQDDIVDDQLVRPVLSFEEVKLEATWGEVDLSVGERIFAYGTADLYNPTDVLNPLDYTDLLDNEKIGMPAIELAWWPGGGDTAIRAIWLPWFAPSRLPPVGERFFLVPSGATLPPVADRELPGKFFQNGEVALRAESRLGGFDLSLTTYYGWQRLPVLVPVATAAEPFVELEPTYDRRLVVGADMAREVEAFILSAEVAQTITEGGRQEDYMQYVFGARRTWFPGDRRLTVSLEYAGEWVNGDAEEETIEVATDLARAFASSVLGRVRFEPIDDLELSVTGAWLLDGPDSWYVRPEASYKFGAHTEVAAGFDLLDGEDGGFFEQFDDDDRVFLDVKLSF
jgi:hypothetical protein